LNILKEHKFYKFIDRFNEEDIVFDRDSIEDIYTMNYLSLYNSGEILKQELKFISPEKPDYVKM
jgi:hypothetical protein